MDEQTIQSIVNSVLRELGEQNVPTGQVTRVQPQNSGSSQNNPPAYKPTESAGRQSASKDQGAGLEDLSLDKFVHWNGIENAHNESVNSEMVKQTAARVCQGRAGPRPRTRSLLRFLADHSRSKDTVVKEVTPEWLEKQNLWEVQTRVTDKSEYLRRPDLGRKLSDEAKKIIGERCKKSPQVQVVISDGLSTDAVTNNLEEIIPPLMKGLESAGFSVGTPFFLRYGRVKAQDEIGSLLQAEANLLLIGERPGLGQSESLSCYCVYKPTESTVESDRMVISNIHRGGTPPIEAAAVIVDLTRKMLEQKASGLALKR
ncbi:ethanolamine ammonia-lyase light chain [Streptosporangium jomthongense]|uniref:Ethanolamine ammonia-lyase small subunit n=1 Tax=Marinobacter aromaticivorans TaxID=1494078 RepID=A0ABW2IU83_9GAMM|nr:ethanolamine ammonia-lyase subunit EutC [Marinobacter aromaticivorans]GGE61172.1 ethanolamine ammonia-lyase light chain [Streptosporangium jomthongense]